MTLAMPTRPSGAYPLPRGMHRVRMTEPAPPAHVKGAAEMRLLLAWIEAAAATGGSAGLAQFEAAVLELAFDPADYTGAERHALAMFHSELLHERARAAGMVSEAANFIRRTAAREVVEAFGKPDPVEVLMGRREFDEHERAWTFVRGLADLSEQECRAMELHLERFGDGEIAGFMDRRSRHFSQGGLRPQTVRVYRLRAQAKLRQIFGLPPLADDDEDAVAPIMS